MYVSGGAWQIIGIENFSWRQKIFLCSSLCCGCSENSGGFFFRGEYSFGQLASVVLGHAVLPFQKLGNGLRLNAHFHPAQTGQQKPHFSDEATLLAGMAIRRL